MVSHRIPLCDGGLHNHLKGGQLTVMTHLALSIKIRRMAFSSGILKDGLRGARQIAE